MKILIIAENGDLVRDLVEKAGHAVVAIAQEDAQLSDLLLQFKPHVVFVEKSEQMVREVEHLQTLFSTVRFVVLGFSRGTTWTKTIRQALRNGRINAPWRPETPECRQIVFDIRYYAFCSKTKLKRSGASGKSEETLATQALRLLWMLRTAKKTHAQASLYAKAKSQVNHYEWEETIYRTIHGSFKAPAWARDQLGRSIGYLGYYIPGIDLDGLPEPIEQPAHLRFLHYEAQLELHYTLFGLTVFGNNHDLAMELYRAIHWRFSGENSAALSQTSIALTGLAFTMHMVGLAHATTVDWLLNPSTLRQLDHPQSRSVYRALQTFADLWGFRDVMADQSRLDPILHDLHADQAETLLPETLRIPSFGEFLEALKAATPENNPNQN